MGGRIGKADSQPPLSYFHNIKSHIFAFDGECILQWRCALYEFEAEQTLFHVIAPCFKHFE